MSTPSHARKAANTFAIHRHDRIKNALQMVAHKAVGASIFHVEREPWLIRQGAKDKRGRVCKDGLRGDLKIRGMHALKTHSIVDVKGTFPDGGENRSRETKHLIEKVRRKRSANSIKENVIDRDSTSYPL